MVSTDMFACNSTVTQRIRFLSGGTGRSTAATAVKNPAHADHKLLAGEPSSAVQPALMVDVRLQGHFGCSLSHRVAVRLHGPPRAGLDR